MEALRESRKRLRVWNKLKLFSPRESFPTRKKRKKRNPNKSRRVCTAYGYRSSNRIEDSWLAQYFRELGYLMCGKPLTVLPSLVIGCRRANAQGNNVLVKQFQLEHFQLLVDAQFNRYGNIIKE